MSKFNVLESRVKKVIGLLSFIVIDLTTTVFVGIIGISAAYGFYELVSGVL